MNKVQRFSQTSVRITAVIALASGMFTVSAAEPAQAGRTVLTYVNRLYLGPPAPLAYGYFVDIEGIPGPLFYGPPSEVTAHFT